MAALPRILSEAGEREREREAARESQELGTLLYLTVTRDTEKIITSSGELKTAVFRNLIFEAVF